MTTTRRASLCLVLVTACSDGGTTRTELTVHSLQNTGMGTLREFSRRTGTAAEMGEPERPPDDGGMIIPDPGGECPFYEYREEHTVVVGADGQIVSETFVYCSRCLPDDGSTIGEETCVEEPILPPDVICTDSSDGMSYCYECVADDGTIVDGACYPIEPEPPSPDDCFAKICEADPFCCEAGWDATCDELLGQLCLPDGSMDPGGPATCEEELCRLDPYCCEVEWDRLCDVERAEVCGCDDTSMPPPDEPPPPDDCTVTFCDVAPDCCNGAWDETCDATLREICNGPSDGSVPTMP